MAGNPRILVHDIETSLTLAMRLIVAEEQLDKAKLAYSDARELWLRTRDEADRQAGLDIWCRWSHLPGEIGKLATAGRQRLDEEQKRSKRESRKYWSWWRAAMSMEIQDLRYRNSHYPDLIPTARSDSPPRLDGLPYFKSAEWNRLEALGQRHLAVWQAMLQSEQLAPQRQKMAAAFGKKRPGQRSVWANEEPHDRPKQRADLGQEKLWRQEDLKKKLLAELDEHPLSQDWAGLAEAKLSYNWAMNQLIEGKEIYRHQIPAGHWEVLSTVYKGCVPVLTCDEDTIVKALSDPDEPLDDEDEEPEPWPDYPGCPAGRNPKAGKYLNAKATEAVIRAWKAAHGERTPDRKIAEWINMRREQLGITEEDRYISIENCGRIRRSLVEAGKLIEKLAVEHYRRLRRWRTLPAACVLPDDPDKDKKAGGKMTKAEVDASFEQIAADLRKRAPDLTL